MFRPVLILGTVALTGLAAAAMAQTDTAQAPTAAQAPLALSEIIRGLEERGYRITDVDMDADGIEVEGLNAEGARIEARLEPATGAVLSETADD